MTHTNGSDPGEVGAAVAARGRFLAAASHDLRQPLQAMRFFHSVLEGQVGDARARRTLAMMGRALSSGERLLNALLDVSTLDAGSVTPQPESFAIAPLLCRLADEFGPQAAGRNVSLCCRSRPFTVFTDPLLLERILRNLIGNAVRYTCQGRIVVAVRRRGGGVRVEVWDTGPGIPEDRIQAIFDEFVRLEGDRCGGLGLGLAIVRRLAGLLDAPLVVRSRPGQGSLFAVTVPGPVGSGQPVPEPPSPGDAGMRGRSVLVVDDDAMVLMAMRMMLESWDLTVLAAGDRDGALRCLDEGEPHLVLTDLRLPGGSSGFEVVDRVRSRLGRDVPAIVLTGATGEAEMAEGLSRGVTFLHKPIQPEPLRRAILAALGG